MVRITGGEKLITPAAALVFQPFTFVHPSVGVDEDAKAIALAFFIEQAFIDAVLVLFYPKVADLAELFVIKLVTYHLIILKCVAIIDEMTILFTRRPETSLYHLLVDMLRNFGIPPASHAASSKSIVVFSASFFFGSGRWLRLGFIVSLIWSTVNLAFVWRPHRLV